MKKEDEKAMTEGRPCLLACLLPLPPTAFSPTPRLEGRLSRQIVIQMRAHEPVCALNGMTCPLLQSVDLKTFSFLFEKTQATDN